MNYLTPANNYALVFPDGEVMGFEESEMAQAYMNKYYRERIIQLHKKEDYEELEQNEERTWQEIYTILGVNEGECRVYNIDELMESVRESSILEEEKEEIIRRLLDENIDLNINDFGIDDILIETPNHIY
ncbi:MAG: hypothetical protein ACRC2K_14220 [Clostridium sp.]